MPATRTTASKLERWQGIESGEHDSKPGKYFAASATALPAQFEVRPEITQAILAQVLPLTPAKSLR